MTRLVLVAGLLLAIAACGSETVTPRSCDPEVPAGATAVTTESTDNLRFDPDELTAPAGDVHIALNNPSSLPHSLVLGNVDDFKLNTDAGGECGSALTLDPGTYPFHCDVPGHQEAGMKGVLIVE